MTSKPEAITWNMQSMIRLLKLSLFSINESRRACEHVVVVRDDDDEMMMMDEKKEENYLLIIIIK